MTTAGHVDKRRHRRSDEFAGTVVDVMVEDRSNYSIIHGAVIQNHSEGGLQMSFPDSHALCVGDTVVVFAYVGSPPRKERLDAHVVWMKENAGKTQAGLELVNPLMGVPYYF
ncbi:MAG: PilZ domain-containing protein [Nitrospinae bacterium]|nr:PilZ domain-containing protein [Nitrospinota bacterium]